MTEPTDVTTVLAVIDATLEGEAVAPEHADLAELSLILAAERERTPAAFAATLDDRVAHRFSGRPSGAEATPAGARPHSRWRWLFTPGLAVGAAALIAVIVVLAGGGGRSTPTAPVTNDLKGAARSAPGVSVPAPNASSSAAAGGASAGADAGRLSTFGAATGATTIAAPTAPSPPTSGRQVVQSAQLSLSARPNHVDDVAQQVFNVVAVQNGVVENSNVTSTATYGNAQFALRVPSANLAKTLTALSQLHGANVVSRSDASQDVTGQVGGAGRRLAEARALRTSLLRQLAAATTVTAVSSLKAQIRDVDAAIDRDLSALRALQHRVAYSEISVNINSVTLPVQPVTHGGGFTLSRAAHDAGRVLVVAAGVALIALAVLVPAGLLVALGLWVAAGLRRRRREQVLDLI